MQTQSEKVAKLRAMLDKERPNLYCLTYGKKVQKVKGLGDVIAALTGAVGIKPCKGCKKRQSWLNKKLGW